MNLVLSFRSLVTSNLILSDCHPSFLYWIWVPVPHSGNDTCTSDVSKLIKNVHVGNRLVSSKMAVIWSWIISNGNTFKENS